MKFEDLKKKDILLHPAHGLIKVKEVVLEEEKRVSVTAYPFKDGKTNKEVKVELKPEDMKDLKREIHVEAKIHFGNCETQVQKLLVPLSNTLTVGEFLSPIQALCKQGFHLYAHGQQVNPKIRAINVMENNSKLILFSTGESAASKPEGPRKFVRFPTHVFDSEFYVSTND